MTLKELDKDKELSQKLIAELEEKARSGENPAEAQIEVFKAHNIEFDEDEIRAAMVDKMELDEDALEKVAGGAHDGVCVVGYYCFIAFLHKLKGNDETIACWSDFSCITANKDLAGADPED